MSNRTSNGNSVAIQWFSIQNIMSYISAILILIWIVVMQASQLLHFSYVAVAVVACFCCAMNVVEYNTYDFKDRRFRTSAIFALVFAIILTFTNYYIWIGGSYTSISSSYSLNFWNLLVVFIGSALAGFQINIFFSAWKCRSINKKSKFYHPVIVFFAAFALIAIVDFVIFFNCKYPGIVSPDTISQIQQNNTGQYTNHHPFFHTLTIKAFMSLGMFLFNDINAALATYCVFQILFLSAAFAFTVSTLNRLRLPLPCLAVIICCYILIPYNIAYSFTVWKDIMFAGFSIIFTVSLYRSVAKIGPYQWLNYCLLCVSSLGFFLFRSNSFFAFFVFVVACCFLLFKKDKRILIMLVSVFLIGMFMRYPLMSVMKVPQPNMGESLSVPCQQIARTYNTYKDLSDEDSEFLNKVIDLNKMQSQYVPANADNIKNILRDQNPNYFKEHLSEYTALYISYGLRHPDTYLTAWADLISGYICSGSSYYYFPTNVSKNNLGIYQTASNQALSNFFDNYYASIKNDPFAVVRCIGFFTWVLLLVTCVSICKRNRSLKLCCVLQLAAMFSLILSAPLNSEFRYAYAMVATIPFLFSLSLLDDNSTFY